MVLDTMIERDLGEIDLFLENKYQYIRKAYMGSLAQGDAYHFAMYTHKSNNHSLLLNIIFFL
jgi:hypothetical protein